jgi:hypothetical protein
LDEHQRRVARDRIALQYSGQPMTNAEEA